jgi:hypothetical protein
MTTSRMQCVIVWILAGVLTGCATQRTLPESSGPETLRIHLKPGDRVEVATREGQRISFKVTEVGESALAGTAAGNKHVELAYGQIAQIKVRRLSGPKNALVVAGLLGMWLLIEAAAQAAILSASAP